MKVLIHQWSEFVIRFRLPIILLTVVAIAFGLYNGRGIPFDNTNERYFIEGDPNLVAFDELLDLYGDIDYLVVGVEARPQDEDVFVPETLRMIEELTAFLESQPAVTQIRSLTRYQYTHSDSVSMATDDLIEDVADLEADPQLMRETKEILAGEELALGTLITEDFRHTRIAARTEHRRAETAHNVRLVNALNEFIAEQGYAAQGYDLHISGQPLINQKFEYHSLRDSQTLNPLMALFMIVVLFVSFRSVSGTLLPWLVIGAGIILLNGIQGVLGYPHSPVDQALIPTMIIIGIGVSVHVMVEFYHGRQRGLDAEAAAKDTTIHLWRPAFFTAVTTSAGFFALSVTRIVPVREFAVLGAIGPLLLFLLALTVLPALLSYVSRVSPTTTRVVSGSFVTRLTQRVPDFTLRYRNPILAVGFLAMVFAAISVPAIKVDTNYLNYFKQNNPARTDMVYFDETFRGVMPIEVIIDSGVEGGVKDPAFLRRMEAFQNYLESLDTVGEFNTLIDFLKQINQALNGDDPAFYRLPDTPEMTAQFLFLYENSGPEEDLTDMKDFDDRYARMTVPMVNMVASRMDQELQMINRELATEFSDLDVSLTGGMVMFNAQDKYTGEGMFKSFGIALLVVSLFFIMLFRSFKYGLLSIIPSVLPILIAGGVVGLLGISLDLGSMIVGAMTIGIAVDDAIHVMNRYLAAKEAGKTTHDAIYSAMTESGRAVVYSSLILVLGFSVLAFGSFIPIIYVGIFGALIMFLALLGDLLFLPAILYLIDGEKSQVQEDDHFDSADALGTKAS
jgi:predicted RND superfamily exporter protein